MNPIKITDTTLRDGQQSLIATRMKTEQIMPIIEKMDSAGFYSMEMWGGATFDSCLRFLKEDPWERLRKIRSKVKNTKLQMLLRGQNILGYKMYPDDVVEYFIQKSIANGIDIIRVFDALNDIRNLETSVKTIKKEKSHAQLAISYTLSEVHTLDYYTELSKQFENIGADSICIKDMAGLLLPQAAFELVKTLKQTVKIPIEVHSHYTSGVAAMSYLKAIEAGADIIDTAISPFALGTSQPATDIMVKVLENTQYSTNIDSNLLKQIADYFRPIREKAIEDGLLSPKVLGADIETLIYQVPGGMLSNLVSQLKAQKAENRYSEVLDEIPKVRADLGYPPLVTPTSQIVGTQAVMNVLSGERYKVVPKETKALVRGEYGKTPVAISDDIKQKIIGDETVITCRPADNLKPMLSQIRSDIKNYIQQDEDILSYALFPSVAEEFFKFRQAQKYKVDPKLADTENKIYPI